MRPHITLWCAFILTNRASRCVVSVLHYFLYKQRSPQLCTLKRDAWESSKRVLMFLHTSKILHIAFSAPKRSSGAVRKTLGTNGFSSFSEAPLIATIKEASNKNVPSSNIAPKKTQRNRY